MITVESILQKIELKNQARDGDKSALAKLKSMAQTAHFSLRKELFNYLQALEKCNDKELDHLDSLDKLQLKLAKKLDGHYNINQEPVEVKQASNWIGQTPEQKRANTINVDFYSDLSARNIKVI